MIRCFFTIVVPDEPDIELKGYRQRAQSLTSTSYGHRDLKLSHGSVSPNHYLSLLPPRNMEETRVLSALSEVNAAVLPLPITLCGVGSSIPSKTVFAHLDAETRTGIARWRKLLTDILDVSCEGSEAPFMALARKVDVGMIPDVLSSFEEAGRRQSKRRPIPMFPFSFEAAMITAFRQTKENEWYTLGQEATTTS